MADAIIEQIKRCTKCGETKGAFQFYRVSAEAERRRAVCIVCTKRIQPPDPIKARARYEKQREAAGKYPHPDRIQCVCKTCGAGFSIPPAWARKGRGGCCSRKCADDLKTATWVTRFWSKVSIASSDECWPWKAGRNSDGYGTFTSKELNGNVCRGAHIIAFELSNAYPVPTGLIVRHKCDNPPCCNPAHLETGTHADNAHDRETRGRSRPRRGTANALAKLNEIDVRNIRQKYRNGLGTFESIASEYRISGANVGCIIRRETWRHLD